MHRGQLLSSVKGVEFMVRARWAMAVAGYCVLACAQQPPPCGPPLPNVPVPERARYCCISSEGDRENFVCLTLTSTIHPCSIDWCCECQDR